MPEDQMFVLRNLSRLLDRPKALQDRVFDKLFRQAEIAKYSDVERRQYESSLKEYWDYTSTLETAEKKGEIRGRAEGEKSKAIEIARRLRSQGMSDSEVSSLTGLSVDEVKAL